ncbi:MULTISPECIES: amylo-alpha-1,6-glucosidase [unclassified Microbacterium]|uniref:amylo-alpha-1,6-glucosidase n=1 Tax=unclassified Microbacterium TaxID=2609290 RepID=UPI0012F772C5|nr:glycogen debranching protein [Microbacterium sp. MAH-37]MVQ41567.1 glycogen debranching protein [Microbacterium sp. MAH-37]
MTFAELAGRHLDLVTAPFTLPKSRILVFRDEDAADGTLRVHTSEYERWLEDCRVLDGLAVLDAAGAVLPVTDVLPHRIAFGPSTGSGTQEAGGSEGWVAEPGPRAPEAPGSAERCSEWGVGSEAPMASLTFDGPGALSIGGAERLRVRLTFPDGRVEEHPLGSGVRIVVAGDRSAVIEPGDHTAALAACAVQWDAWFAKCPVVRDDLQQMAAFCWWVLGANIVSLPSLGDARGVVPSKIGYVGVWQWDAYFIAVGLRHGDPELAREQLDIAFRFPSADGQLPDVVHELGVLATSDDLPEGDRAKLRRTGSAVADPTAPVPLTKPPLAAWALRKVLEAEDAPDWARTQLATIIRSQDWWFAGSDLDGDGMPEYGHPYSSGLDDSPIFDGPIPTSAPDLGAYLVRQDREIADLLARYEPDAATGRFLERAERTEQLLHGMWDDELGRFLAFGDGQRIDSDTVVGLMPLLTGTLPDGIRDALRAAVDDDGRFALEWGLPTVAASDPDFSPERMWRGPIWINTSALIAEGLEASGYPERARELREQTVRLVVHGGGPHEYYNPFTGFKAERATTAFGWSAAWFLDLAVLLSRD